MARAEQAKEQKIGRYLLYDTIASGGMATIHFGRLQSQAGFTKTVAIKKLHQHFARDPEFVAMFMDEARIAARIQHPNVVTTLDAVSVDSELFLVMEYVEGESLARLWKTEHKEGRRIPPDVACGIVMGVLRGLHAAHEAADEVGEPLDIIHRDVSPHNIIVGRDGVARVLDFGVAKVAGQLQSTRKGQVKGKLNYMAPEQAGSETLDRRADIYAAGVVLWEALTGKRMRDGVDQNAIYAQLIGGVAVAPSEVADGLPEGIDDVVLKALAKDPTERYATADEFAEDLERVTGSVSPRAIGRWVQRCAADVLAARARKRKEIEAKSSGIFVAPTHLLDLDQATETGTTTLYDDESTGVTRTDALLGALSMRFDPKVPNNRRRVLMGALLAFALGGLVAVVGLRSGESEPSGERPAPMGASGSPAPTEPRRSDPTPSAASPPPAATSASVPSSAKTLSEPPRPPPSTRPTARPTSSARPPGSIHTPGPKPPGPDCDPPYTVTENGVRRYKVECL